MVIVMCLVNNKVEKFQFFKKTFLFTDISINVTFGISFFTLSNNKINFIN